MRQAQAGAKVKVGVIGDEAASQEAGGSLTVADVASFHEFGLGVPERSFIRAYVDENDGPIRVRLRDIANRVLTRNQSPRSGLEILGLLTVGEIQQRMAAGLQPDLSDAYVKRLNKPDKTARLIRTGQLRSSITHAVEPGGPGGA